jgi:hypothetical protein
MPNIIETFNLIDGFAKLPVGWNFGEGVPASFVSLQQSKDMLRFAFDSGIREFEAFPGIDGEIQLCCYKEENTLEITFEINGATTFSLEKNDKRLSYKKDISFNEAIKILKDFAHNKCHSYESSTSTIITVRKKGNSQVWLLDPRQLTVAYPSSIKIVPRMQAQQSVTISSDTIRQSPELQLSSGKFPMSQSRSCLA